MDSPPNPPPILSASVWPEPADPAAASRLIERFTAIGPAEARFAARPAGAAALGALGGNSPFLADLAVRESAVLRAAFGPRGPDPVLDAALTRLAEIRFDAPRARIAAEMRRAKRIVALITALADIGGVWPLGRVTETLSTLAETSLTLAVAHLLHTAADQGALNIADRARPGETGGLIVLGMGKLGARELNYSSDIDLILLFDPPAPGLHPGADDDESMNAALTSRYARLARDLVTLMEARDADGYVFRTDLRLRPDPAATPPVIALPAALAYYEGMGQNWERAAMIKARPVAGDRAAGQAFLDAIRPFVWRRGLDFAAVADIEAMKQRINAHRRLGNGANSIAGFNVKLGPGGIREIEFIAQTLQLVWGGRDPGLRSPETLTALGHLVRAGRLDAVAADGLAAAYTVLRRIEHRLQMVADRQTHTLPEDPAALDRFAVFMGEADGAALAAMLRPHLARVRDAYASVFDVATAPGDDPDAAPLLLDGVEPPPETLARLTGMGFTRAEHIIDAARGWRAGRVRATRSPRARDMMDHLLPALLHALAAQPQPDQAFARFEEFVGRVPAGVGLLSMLERNPVLIARIAGVLGAAPMLADHLARHPTALEGLLSLATTEPPGPLLRARLQDAATLEDTIAIIRRTVREQDFAIAVASMEGRLDADSAGLARASLADAAQAALLPRVFDDFASRFGRVRGGRMVVVALGKAGGREMMEGSDLDLMLIYDHPETETVSRGGRALPTSQWFVRAAHAYVAALTAPGADGPLYAVDMRLRPSGNKGPVAVSLAAFRRYHAETAWTWERMALTRARVVAGPRALATTVRAAIEAAIASAARDPARAWKDVASMRARLDRELPEDGPWDVKHRAGGMIDVEFIAQAVQLISTQAAPVRGATTRDALSAAARAGTLRADDAARLIAADRAFRTIQDMVRITVGRHARESVAEAPARVLLRAAYAAGLDAVDLPTLRATMNTMANEVRQIFNRLMEGPPPQ